MFYKAAVVPVKVRYGPSFWRHQYFSPSFKFRHYEATFLGGLIPCERGCGCKDRRVLGLSFIYPIPRVSEDLLPPKSLSEIPTFPSSFYIVYLFTHSPSDNIGKTTFLPLAPLKKSRPFRTGVPPPGGGGRSTRHNILNPHLHILETSDRKGVKLLASTRYCFHK